MPDRDPKVVDAATDRHYSQMKHILDFLGLDQIRYTNLGNGEDYVLVKDGKELVLNVRGNKFDGGFLCVECGLEPTGVSSPVFGGACV